MLIQSTKDAVNLINTLLEYLNEAKVAEIIKKLDIDIYGDNGLDSFDETVLPKDCSINFLKILLLDIYNFDISDLIKLAGDYPKALNIVSKEDIEKYIENCPTDLIKYISSNYCKIYGWPSMRALFKDWEINANNGLYYVVDDLKEASALDLNNIKIDDSCPLSNSMIISIIKEYIKYDFLSLGEEIYIRYNLTEDYIERYIDFDYKHINIKQYNLYDQVAKYEKELKEECNMTLEEFKELNFISTSELADFLIEYTNLVELLDKDWF